MYFLSHIVYNKELQATIGVVGLKTSPVHFYVYLRGHYGKKGRIQFENEFVNIGKGFDWKNQWFLAPYPGIYFISVSGTKDIINKERVTLRALLNGNEIVEALSSTEKTYSPFSFQFSRKLKANDKIELVLEKGIIMFFHFTGWMVEQQLDF